MENCYVVIRPWCNAAKEGTTGVRAFLVKDLADLNRRLGNGDLEEFDEVYEISLHWQVVRNEPLKLRVVEDYEKA